MLRPLLDSLEWDLDDEGDFFRLGDAKKLGDTLREKMDFFDRAERRLLFQGCRLQKLQQHDELNKFVKAEINKIFIQGTSDTVYFGQLRILR